MSEFKCEYCNKTYATLTVLENHKKTAKFCKKIQESRFNIKVEPSKNECTYCKKVFTIPSRLKTHLETCKDKIKADITQNTNRTVEDQITQYQMNEKLLQQEITMLKGLILKLEETNKLLLEKSISSSTVTNTNSNNTVYNIQYNQLFKEIPVITEDDVNKTFANIIYYDMYTNMVESIDDYFINKFVTNFKKYTFTTDASRGILIVKNQNGESDRIHSEQFVLNCFKLGQKELKRLFIALKQYNESQRDEEEITEEEFYIYAQKIESLRRMVCSGDKSNAVIKKTASSLIKNTKKLYAKNSSINLKEDIEIEVS